MTNETDNQLNDKLKTAAGKHLRALEKWAAEQPSVAGVPVMQALTYDLIQVTNGAYLNAILRQPASAQLEGQTNPPRGYEA